MKYELDILQQLVTETLEPAAIQPSGIATDIIVMTVASETGRLQKVFREAAYTCSDTHRFQLYINHHQQDIITISNRIYALREHCAGAVLKEYCSACMSGIETLLTQMRLDFKEEMITTVFISSYFKAETIPAVKKQLVILKKTMQQMEVAMVVQQLLINTYEDYLMGKHEACTYQRYWYLQFMHTQLLLTKTAEAFTAQLYTINYNSLYFFNHIIGSIVTGIEKQKTHIVWAALLKENNRRQIYTGIALYPQHDSIKEMVNCWLSEELYFLQQATASRSVQQTNSTKIKLHISVKQLAYLLQLFEEAGMMEVMVKKELFDLVADTCSTKEQMHIAVKSLQNNCTDVTDHTIDTVHELLMKMVNSVIRKSKERVRSLR